MDFEDLTPGHMRSCFLALMRGRKSSISQSSSSPPNPAEKANFLARQADGRLEPQGNPGVNCPATREYLEPCREEE